MARVRPKPDGDGIVVAIAAGAFVAPDGQEYLVLMGERCHSLRPQVKLWPHVWRPWATTDDIELEQARRALVEAAIAAVEG